MFNWKQPIPILLVLSCGIVGVICQTASISDYPYHVSVEYNNLHSCSGALIVEKWILTVAACVQRNGLADLTVRVSTSVVSTGGKQFAVKSIFIHEDFDPIFQENDIALIELQTPVDYGLERLPVILPYSGFDIAEGTIADLTGWITTSHSNSWSQLTVVSTPIINETICRSSLPVFKELIDSMLCSGFMSEDAELCQATEDAANFKWRVSSVAYRQAQLDGISGQGDIGSPLVYDNQLVGVLSYGLGCIDPTYPVVHTKISSYITWIFSITGIIF